MFFQTWCWLDSIQSKLFLYKSYILFHHQYISWHYYTSYTRSCLVAHIFESILWQGWTHFWKSEKRNLQRQRALLYTKHTGKFTSLKHSLLVLQVKTNTARYEGLLGSRCHNFRHLQHSCSSRAAVLLTCLEDIAQNYPSDCFSCIPETRSIVLFLPF